MMGIFDSFRSTGDAARNAASDTTKFPAWSPLVQMSNEEFERMRNTQMNNTPRSAKDQLRDAIYASAPRATPRDITIGELTILRANGGYVAVVAGELHVCTSIEALHNVITAMVGADALATKG
jgi:hypothetical protein